MRIAGGRIGRTPGSVLAAALLAADPRPVIAVDGSGTVREFNQAAEELYGVAQSQVLGQDALEMLVPRRHHSLFREAMSAYLTAGDDSVFGGRLRVKVRRPDGSEPLVEFTPIPIQAAGEVLFGIYVHEVTEDGAPVPAVAETDVRFGMLSELAPVGIVQADRSGRCSFVNGRWCKFVGLPVGHAIGRPWLDSVHPDDAGSVRHRLAAAMSRGEELRADCRLRSADGRDTWVQAAVRPIKGLDGRYTGQLAAFTNVDARKRAEAEREEARRQLAEQNIRLRDMDQAKTQFVGTVSHELRSPLTSIVSFTQLLQEDTAGLPPEAAQYVGIIERNAERLLRMVSDLLYLDQLDEGAVTLDKEPVRIPQIAADAVLTESASAASAGVRLQLDECGGPEIKVDRVRLQQVLDNLITNAIKFSDRGATISVSATWTGSEWLLIVRDEGIGIPASDLRGLFGRFFRAANAVSRQVPGTGLGLATAKAIAELHGGRIEVASAEGVGTTVTVHLPAAA